MSSARNACGAQKYGPEAWAIPSRWQDAPASMDVGAKGLGMHVPRLGVHDGAAGALWAASGPRRAQCEQFVAPVPEVENLTAISNFWTLTARSLIGKSWKFVDIARLWPGLSRRRPLMANNCDKMCEAADTPGHLLGTTVGLRSQPVAKLGDDPAMSGPSHGWPRKMVTVLLVGSRRARWT